MLGDAASQVEIPDIVNGTPGLARRSLSVIGEQIAGCGARQGIEGIETVEAGKHVRLEVYNGIEQYHVPYKAYLSNSLTGKKLEISGTLSSKKPFNYLIILLQLLMKINRFAAQTVHVCACVFPCTFSMPMMATAFFPKK